MRSKSTYNISTSVNEGIVEVVVTGKLTNDSIVKLRNEVRTIVKSINARNVLCDIRMAKGRTGYADTYFRVTESPSFFHNINMVLLDIPENANLRSFHEYTAKNAGIPIKWFTDADDARAWLKRKSESDKNGSV